MRLCQGIHVNLPSEYLVNACGTHSTPVTDPNLLFLEPAIIYEHVRVSIDVQH